VGLFDTYADQSDYYDPWLTKRYRRGLYYLKNMGYKLWLLSKNPKSIIGLKLGAWRRATLDRFKYSRAEQFELVNGHPPRMGAAQEIAHRNYRLAPQPVAVHLFRCTEHTYYLNDPEHLGWREFAQGGVQIHEVPGNHFNLFAAPHDAACARVLQAALDNC